MSAAVCMLFECLLQQEKLSAAQPSLCQSPHHRSLLSTIHRRGKCHSPHCRSVSRRNGRVVLSG